MINIIKAQVKEIIYKSEGITKVRIIKDGRLHDCINYNQLTGGIKENDVVLLNTTAVELGLGSGGYHFVVANMSNENYENMGEGHIMKLRYTPMQINCKAAEAQESPYHEIFNSFESLEGLPVIAGTLHSMLAPIVLALSKLAGKNNIIYIMTDGGALPIWISETTARLRRDGILKGTITYGNAFGGDLECINIYTALIAAKEVMKADAVIVCMGPGIAGTATKYGFSGIEQSQIIDAVNTIKGKAIAVPRLSFTEDRSRHTGLSHHTATCLGKLCHTRAFIALPELEEPEAGLIRMQLAESGISERHDISYWRKQEVERLLENHAGLLDKMGKGFKEDKEYFITCGLSAYLTL